MSNSDNMNNDSLPTEIAKIERDLALNDAHNANIQRIDADFQRDAALNIAVNEAAEREKATRIAQAAQMRAEEERAASGYMAVQKKDLRNQLENEKAATANSNFWLALLVSAVLAAGLAGVIWYWNSSKTPATDTTVISTVQSPSAGVTSVTTRTEPTRDERPIIVNSPPPVVIVKTVVQKPKVSNAPKKAAITTEAKPEITEKPVEDPDGMKKDPTDEEKPKTDTPSTPAKEGSDPPPPTTGN